MRAKIPVLPVLSILALAALSACDGSSSGSGGTMPANTLQAESPGGCASVDSATGAVTAPASCHVHIVLDQTYPQDVVRLTVTGRFLASEVYLLFNASNASAADGWVIQFNRGFAGATSLESMACETEACTDNALIDTFTGAYSVNDSFTIAAEVDRSGGASDGLKAWADTNPATTPAGDVSDSGSNPSSFAGDKVGVSVRGATVTGIAVTTP
jgi:hypothetical protein